MGYNATIRAMQAAERRQQRDAQRRLRELERQAKERAKLSAIEQANLEVETFQNQLDVLLSVHKELGEPWDWKAIAASLPPPCPQRNSRKEQRAKQRAAVLPAHQREASQILIEQGRLKDEEEFQRAAQAYSEQLAEWEKLKNLARRILAGEHKAFTETLVELNPFAEISDLGSAIHFTVHTAKLVECVLKVNGKQAIPTELKALTASGKVSIKPMPKGRFHEIYQDYVCGCVLRIARELFALFPVDTALVTASVDSSDPRTGRVTELPVLSVVIPRAVTARLDFGQLDPSDAMENFQHRGDFKASRKAEAFQSVTPLTPADIAQASFEELGFHELLANIRKLREQFKTEIAQLSQNASIPVPQTSPAL
ncbi:MAG: hypothetical protein DME23_13355 [Verrucomicrobia bacterium]|nr:MAG: hypothetical protein DME23_13355 [Verrucomicrobiota bacterium]